MEADFSGYATKAGLKCSDGRTIMPDAFKAQDKHRVPLIWQHGHSSAENVLGHAILENRSDGLYAYGFFNSTEQGKGAKILVEHKDVEALSIYANQLMERDKIVRHGAIVEVSLVLAGANPGAKIDFVAIQHSDDSFTDADDEAVIYTGLELQHEQPRAEMDTVISDIKPDIKTAIGTLLKGDTKVKDIQHADDETVQDIYDSMSDDQKKVLHYMIGVALEGESVSQSDTDENDLTHQEGTLMNVFDQNGVAVGTLGQQRPTLTHDQLQTIVKDAQTMGSFKESFLAHAVEYGIENIDFLFPDAKTLTNSPEMVTRRQEWVASFWNGLTKNPFSRIKTLSTDLTLDAARAKGYVKATLKKEEWFTLSKRVTTPTTVYKKQKLDRDDIIDITDLDVVAWLKAEMRLMLDEEIARACLVGDGREVDDEDKINETNIRPIVFEDDFYAHKIAVANAVVGDGLVTAVLTNRKYYRGLGNPVMYTTEDVLSEMLLAKDTTLRRLYPTIGDLQAALRVRDIQTVPVLENVQTVTGALLFVLVNPADYTVGADKGGAVSMFDDFDIDYNQYKYLIETRISGALTKFKSALVFSRTDAAGDTLVTPTTPTFVSGTGVVTIPAVTGVVYKNADTNATLSSGAQSALAVGATLNVDADPAAGYVFPHNFDEDWSFTRP